MRCEEKIGAYCRQAVSYKKYAEYRRCDRCCIDCLEPCSYLCSTALRIMNWKIEGEDHECKNR